MKKIFSSFAAAIAGLLMLMNVCHADVGSAGKEFYFAFQPNYLGDGGSTLVLSLFISGKQDTQGTVDIEGLNFHTAFSVQANKITTISIPKLAHILPADAISRLAVHVVAQNDVTVYGLSKQYHTTDAFLALPVAALGLEYYALTYASNISGLPAQIVLIGAYDNTEVVVTPYAALTNHPAGKPFTVKLNRGEAYMLTSLTEVTGTRLVASAPIAVMSGVEGVHIPSSSSGGDHVVEMMPPVSAWGKSFLTVPLATRLKGDFFRILASEDGTKVTINGQLKATLQRGQFYETILLTRSQIATSAPALVAQFATGTTFDGVVGDPFEMLVPPAEQFLADYTFSTPTDSFPRQYVNVVIPTGAIGSLRLDGMAVDAALFSPIGSSGFSGGQVAVLPNSHTIKSIDDVPFGIYVYGFGDFDSYGYPGGMSFNAINPVGDPFVPNMRLVQLGNVVQGNATDSEDVNANGILDAGEDLNGNGQIDRRSGPSDRDTGIFKIELLAGASNLQLDVLPFVPGAQSAQFTIMRVDTAQPGLGVVQASDGAGNKIESAVSIGAIPVLKNVRAIVTLSAADIEVDTATFKKQPFSIMQGPDQQIIEWHFDTFSANSSADLSFDVLFKKPVNGEKRVVAHALDLYYTGANGEAVHTGLGSRAVDVLTSSYVFAVATDASSYAASSDVKISVPISNRGSAGSTVPVQLQIQTDSGQLVATLPVQTIFVPLDRQVVATAVWNAGTIFAGVYRARAQLLDANGVAYAQAATAFAVVTGTTTAASKVSTDKQTYLPSDTVRVNSRVANTTANMLLTDLVIETKVTNPDGSIRFARTESLAQLSQGALKDYGYSVVLSSVSAGQYGIALKVSRGDGAVLAQSSTTFAVGSSADSGNGLVGTIAATPAQIPQGDSLALSFGATNLGNSILNNVPLTVSIVDPIGQYVLFEFPVTQTLAMGAVYNGDANWISSGTVGRTYVAVLSATVGGKVLTLAQTNLTLLAPRVPPVKLNIEQVMATGTRVLAFASCNDGEDEDDHQPSSCVNQRARTIGEMLAMANVPYTVITTEAAFKLAFRSGRYNTYWISGKVAKVDKGMSGEIREAVYSGEALVLDGTYDERNKLLDAVAGINWKGKLGQTDLPVSITETIFGAQQKMSSVGRADKIELDGGVRQAVFAGTKNNTSGPAIVSHAYGAGKVLTYAFDLPSSMKAQSQWQAVAASGLTYVMPEQAAVVTPGAQVNVRTSIGNQANATGIQLASTLPTGASYMDSSPAGTNNGGVVSWLFNLAEAQTQDVLLTLRAPAAAGTFALQTSVSSVTATKTLPYGDILSVPVTVVAASKSSTDAAAALKAFNLTVEKDIQLRETLLAKLDEAMTDMDKNSATGYEAAIEDLLDLTDKLTGLTSVDTRAVRLGVDRILKEAQWRWNQLQASH